MFALTVSDIVPQEYLDERVGHIVSASGSCNSLGFVCVRDDAMDADRFVEVATMASACGLGLILESEVIDNIRLATDALTDHRPIVLCPNGDQKRLIALAATRGLPVILSSDDPERLIELSALAESSGCDRVLLNPMAECLSDCLSSTVGLRRMASPGSPADRPIVVRAMSGEYALSMASVLVLRGGSLAILDYLDTGACRILDSLIHEFT